MIKVKACSGGGNSIIWIYLFLEMAASLCSSDWPDTCDRDQTVPELIEVCLPLPPKCLGLKVCAAILEYSVDFSMFIIV